MTAYSIQVASQMVGLTPGMVRRCLREGLVRTDGTQRVAEDQLAQLRRIRRLTQDLGVNMAGVEIILRLVDEMHQRR